MLSRRRTEWDRSFDHSSGVEAAREVAIAVGEDRRAAWPSMGTPGDGRPGAAAAAAWDVTRVAWIPTGTGETDEEKRRTREDLQRASTAQELQEPEARWDAWKARRRRRWWERPPKSQSTGYSGRTRLPTLVSCVCERNWRDW
jgi:hypothetical protein